MSHTFGEIRQLTFVVGNIDQAMRYRSPHLRVEHRLHALRLRDSVNDK